MARVGVNDAASSAPASARRRGVSALALLLGCVSACTEPRSSVQSTAPDTQRAAAESADLRRASSLMAFWDGRRWGYRDGSGRVAIPASFLAASDFTDGRALVLLDESYVYVDTAGAVVGELVPRNVDRATPLPSDTCASLEAYAAELGFAGEAHLLVANPAEGESTLRLTVRPLAYGALQVTEHGWEGMSVVIVLPHSGAEHARLALARILAHHQHQDITAQGMFADDVVTYQLPASDQAGEFFGIRRRRNGGVAIHHTLWAA